ncbi:hypothetical protein NEFER03_0071 [Nematocida sp. LUAm3]|nr:hypothetical protein NEFER03_0071 [Nematocida sp. LUAm3]KAI5173524.1 hypothetical protein NEFER02_0040 [Nematocida sp. LUAm2]KAI5176745.1 hypothetical protein NEFER01_0070 [Nematocida sp. LUAm1]
MASIVNMQFVCGQVSMPICYVLFNNQVSSKYAPRAISLGAINMYSPFTVLFLIMACWLTMVLIKRTSTKYSFPARKEMLLFLCVYFGAISLDLLQCFSPSQSPEALMLLRSVIASFQLGCVLGAFAAAFGTGLIWIFPNRFSESCVGLSMVNTFLTVVGSFVFIFMCAQIGFGFGIFLLLVSVPCVFGGLFSITQLAKLKYLNLEIWSYGSIFVMGLLLSVVAATPFVLGMLIVLISDRYLDGIFLMHLFGFLCVLKIYNLWVIDKEQEIECVNTLKAETK